MKWCQLNPPFFSNSGVVVDDYRDAPIPRYDYLELGRFSDLVVVDGLETKTMLL